MTKWAALAVFLWASAAGAGEYYFEPGQGLVDGTCSRNVRGTGAEPRTLVLTCPDHTSSNFFYYNFSYPESVGAGWSHIWTGSLQFEAVAPGRVCFSFSLWVIDETVQSLSNLSPTTFVSFATRTVSAGEVNQTLSVPIATLLTTFGQNSIPVGCNTNDCRRRRAVLRIGRAPSASCAPGPANTGAIDLQGIRLRFD